MVDEGSNRLLLLLLVVRVKIRIARLTRKIFSVSGGQLNRRRQEMSSFFVHKKHASKHEIVAHRCHVILVGLFGPDPTVLTTAVVTAAATDGRRPVSCLLGGGLLCSRSRFDCRYRSGDTTASAAAVVVVVVGH